MRPLANLERFLERALERPTGRLFGVRLRPVRILRHVEREMELERRVEGRTATLPDRVSVTVNPRDLAALGAPDELARYLADGALAFARNHGYRLSSRPVVALHADPAVDVGDSVVSAAFDPPSTDDTPAPAPESVTRAYQPPEPQPPHAALELSERGGTRRIVEIGAVPVTIGRARDNVLALDDPRVSRHHARIAARGRAIVLTDLRSTNGTRVNGAPVREVALGDGDRIEVGETTIRVRAS